MIDYRYIYLALQLIGIGAMAIFYRKVIQTSQEIWHYFNASDDSLRAELYRFKHEVYNRLAVLEKEKNDAFSSPEEEVKKDNVPLA